MRIPRLSERLGETPAPHDPPPPLSREQRRALRVAGIETSIRVLHATGIAIDLDEAETIAANVVGLYLGTLGQEVTR